MNKERILQLADTLEREGALPKPDLGFNMQYFMTETGEVEWAAVLPPEMFVRPEEGKDE